METIIETLSDYGTQVKDTDMLTEYVRQALKRTISPPLFRSRADEGTESG